MLVRPFQALRPNLPLLCAFLLWAGGGLCAADTTPPATVNQPTFAGRTLAGPHRTDLAVTHLGKNQPATLCSTGEQKALLLGLVLAHADLVAERTGQPPILLLDEVAAHLDPTRRAALFDRLAGTGQVWMTGTEQALFEGLGSGATHLLVNGGTIAAEP